MDNHSFGSFEKRTPTESAQDGAGKAQIYPSIAGRFAAADDGGLLGKTAFSFFKQALGIPTDSYIAL